MLFFVGWFAMISILGREIRVSAFLEKNVTLTGLIIVLSLFLISQKNVTWGMNDLCKASVFHREMIARDDFIRSSVNSGFLDIKIEDKITWPRLFPQHLDIGEDPGDWRNWHWGVYFKAKTVRRIRDKVNKSSDDKGETQVEDPQE